ncbi:zinc-dependent alcohol dehydrogenase family protein [Rhodococcus qingshengii]|uniref:zinc-dependent alcohol dehydrogenase family protein n=1 Tax=Rhodococcus qingshengii TaxID=334542 RepID=UPI001BE93274|nr:NAD(P)-dependent alcohol dehydrogenase [Rhodococcus qingshengii]MBT2272072.1 NAD(P)-dependent alcohol dehydrogenase [Rhodococcus qingshengii]
MTNRAVYVLPPGGLNNLESRTIETPGPGAGEVTIAIHANSLNHHDYLVATGEIATDGPRILLSDAAGEVVAVGDGVTQFSVGDRVMSTYLPHWRSGTPDFDGFGNSPGDGVDGFARDTVTVPVSAVTVMPRNYTYEEAATLPTAGLSAWRALFAGVPIIPGSSVLIPGTSTVALFAVQLAKAVGAQVIATSSAPDKMARLVELGADHVVNYRERPDWGPEAMRLSGGIDLVLDVGGPSTLGQSLAAVRPGGRICALGIMNGPSSSIDLTSLLTKQVTIEGVLVGSRAHQEEMVAGLESLALRPVIDSSYSLDRLADAFERQKSGQAYGKIVITNP